MANIDEIYGYIDEIAPFVTAESWDNSGFLVESTKKEVQVILVALDITPEVVEEAHCVGAGLIVSHHPVIFEPIKRIGPAHAAYHLIRHDISAICAHTNLDLARGGLNDILARRMCLHNIEALSPPDSNLLSLGRIGNLEMPVEREIVLSFVKKNLGCNGLRYTPGKEKIQRVAVCGGAGAGLLHRAAELGADVLVTGDLKHNLMLEAKSLGIMLVDAGHYCTEQVVLQPLADLLREHFSGIEVLLSQTESDPAHYF